MSLLHRWSLPSRGSAPDKSQATKSSDQSKFPTIHIGRAAPRRRANLSSTFSSLFEKPENDQSIRCTESHSETADDQELLTPRRENVPPGANPRNLYMRAIRKVEHQTNETPKIHSFSLSSTESDKTASRDQPSLHQSDKPMDKCERVRSASSSYPSEGIRSPMAGYRSPEPAATSRENYFADDVSSGNTTGEKTQPAQAPNDTVSNSTVAYQISSPSSSPFADPFRDQTEPTSPDVPLLRLEFGVTHGVEQQHKPSSTSEITVPILENEDAISSHLEVSFVSYKRPSAHSTSDNDDGYQLERGTAGSTEHLRPSVDTDRTIEMTVRCYSVSDGEPVWSTIPDVGEKPSYRRTSWMQLFRLNSLNDSLNTSAQRIQKLELRKWVKRVCFRAKAQLENVGKPALMAERPGPNVWRRKWRHKKIKQISKKAKKRLDTDKGGCLGVNKTLEAIKQRVGQPKAIAQHLFGTLVKRKSLEFGHLTSEKNKALASRKRVQSCPPAICT
ncbi:hypothetical protein NUW58_g96 [Xylaria curta]|uniref:Uncharacterized protein n=1 Tax=Xylaria curta TaxID=42375 RepID=A0ACC1PRZ0_9PEZI|nr:hypothetical protein NUW58_g96 [Xylaria curta]